MECANRKAHRNDDVQTTDGADGAGALDEILVKVSVVALHPGKVGTPATKFPRANGLCPTCTVVATVLVEVSMTETLLSPLLAIYTRVPAPGILSAGDSGLYSRQRDVGFTDIPNGTPRTRALRNRRALTAAAICFHLVRRPLVSLPVVQKH